MACMPIVTTRDLREQGHDQHSIDRMLGSGEIVRVRRGGYVIGSPNRTGITARDAAEDHRRLVFATAPQIRHAAVISHVSAAVLHGLPVPPRWLGRVTCTRMRSGRGGGNLTGVLHTYVGEVCDAEIECIQGLTVTSLTRTASDMARLLPRRDAVILLDAALHDERGGEKAHLREEIADRLARDRRRRGARDAGIWLSLASGLAESPVETISRLVFHDARLPTPVLQCHIHDVHGVVVARSDFGWPDFLLAGEADGRAKYETLLRPGERPADAVMREKVRENRIMAAGWGITRWGLADALSGDELARRVSRLLAARGARW